MGVAGEEGLVATIAGRGAFVPELGQIGGHLRAMDAVEGVMEVAERRSAPVSRPRSSSSRLKDPGSAGWG
jgi:hypothetical protein